VSFGRRLVLFFLLIAIVPIAALVSILLFVSGDSQKGKADARVAAGVQTAVAVYTERPGNWAAVPSLHRRCARAGRQSSVRSPVRWPVSPGW
jgi:hypothetical protein